MTKKELRELLMPETLLGCLIGRIAERSMEGAANHYLGDKGGDQAVTAANTVLGEVIGRIKDRVGK